MKKALLILSSLFVCFIIISASIDFIETLAPRKDEAISQILEEAWNEFEVLAYSDLTDESVLYFVISDKENKSDFQQAVQKKLVQYNIDGYSLNILKESEVEK